MDTIAYVLSYLDICEDEYLIDELFSNEKERTIVRAYWLSQSTLEIIDTENEICYLTNGKYHRLDGPAVICSGDQFWYVNDKLHRLDGPAREYINGDKFWYVNNKRHRLDGPAIEYSDGSEEWWVNNKLHKMDGPAFKRDGYESWWINGVEQDTEQMINSIKQKNSKVCDDTEQESKV